MNYFLGIDGGMTRRFCPVLFKDDSSVMASCLFEDNCPDFNLTHMLFIQSGHFPVKSTETNWTLEITDMLEFRECLEVIL